MKNVLLFLSLWWFVDSIRMLRWFSSPSPSPTARRKGKKKKVQQKPRCESPQRVVSSILSSIAGDLFVHAQHRLLPGERTGVLHILHAHLLCTCVTHYNLIDDKNKNVVVLALHTQTRPVWMNDACMHCIALHCTTESNKLTNITGLHNSTVLYLLTEWFS